MCKSFYSEKEQIMFTNLGFGHLLDVILFPPKLYTIAAKVCAYENRQGRNVESLHRCVHAIENCNPYRMTEEFDALIDVDI
jgi:hypothetical protein